MTGHHNQEKIAIRRPHRAAAPQKSGPRATRKLFAPEVQLIDAEGENHGTVALETAQEMALDAGLDLVEISPTNRPPICKILDFGKYKYAAQKKAAEARKSRRPSKSKKSRCVLISTRMIMM